MNFLPCYDEVGVFMDVAISLDRALSCVRCTLVYRKTSIIDKKKMRSCTHVLYMVPFAQAHVLFIESVYSCISNTSTIIHIKIIKFSYSYS